MNPEFIQFVDAAIPIIKNALVTIAVPALLAFIKSELMALNDNTTANGIVHYFRLANNALAVIQKEEPKDEKTVDTAAVDTSV